MIKYSEDHVWLAIDGDSAIVGITAHAQETLGDVVFVELPAIGQSLEAKEVAGVVESVKAAADVHMPVSGQILAVNEDLRADPSLANSDPLGAGWLFKITLLDRSQLTSLLDERAYAEFSA